MTSINPIFEPFIEAHRYKVAKGGRGMPLLARSQRLFTLAYL